MMRAINPREAELMDPAAGTHVRFRLGGAFFPPLVFYKIFTHRCDPMRAGGAVEGGASSAVSRLLCLLLCT